MTYQSATEVESKVAPGVVFTVAKMSFERRLGLLERIVELARRAEFLAGGPKPAEHMEAALLQAEIDGLYLRWGLLSVSGLELDGVIATPTLLVERGPEELCREALAAVRLETGLSAAERKN
jgi:hypothetical protein